MRVLPRQPRIVDAGWIWAPVPNGVQRAPATPTRPKGVAMPTVAERRAAIDGLCEIWRELWHEDNARQEGALENYATARANGLLARLLPSRGLWELPDMAPPRKNPLDALLDEFSKDAVLTSWLAGRSGDVEQHPAAADWLAACSPHDAGLAFLTHEFFALGAGKAGHTDEDLVAPVIYWIAFATTRFLPRVTATILCPPEYRTDVAASVRPRFALWLLESLKRGRRAPLCLNGADPKDWQRPFWWDPRRPKLSDLIQREGLGQF